jgi:hypothetical protein
MHNSGTKVSYLRQLISEYQASLGLQPSEWTAQSVAGKFIATKQYDLKKEQLYELLDSHGVLPEFVRIKWNLSNDPEKQGIYLAKNYKYSPITDQAYK